MVFFKSEQPESFDSFVLINNRQNVSVSTTLMKLGFASSPVSIVTRHTNGLKSALRPFESSPFGAATLDSQSVTNTGFTPYDVPYETSVLELSSADISPTP